MTPKDTFSFIPHDLQSIPWIQNLVTMLQEQSRVIQEQAKIIQEQVEEIAALKKTVQEQKDEINRLKKMSKRPKLREKKVIRKREVENLTVIKIKMDQILGMTYLRKK